MEPLSKVASHLKNQPAKTGTLIFPGYGENPLASATSPPVGVPFSSAKDEQEPQGNSRRKASRGSQEFERLPRTPGGISGVHTGPPGSSRGAFKRPLKGLLKASKDFTGSF